MIMLPLWAFLLLAGVECYFQPIVQQRTNFYPVRTNCLQPCQQNRYRWNIRPAVAVPRPVSISIKNVARPIPMIPATMRPTIPTKFTFWTTQATTSGTLPTPGPETTTTPATTVPTEPETPPPEIYATPSSTAAEATSHETTEPSTSTKYMRPEKKDKQRFYNPCPVGHALSNEFNSPISCNYLNEPNGGCPENYWCHTGASFSTTACCPRVSDKEQRCDQRRDTGEGSDLVARWYFDKQSGLCKRFLYKGMRGNENNFITKAQCVDACESVVTIDKKNPCRISDAAKHKNGSRVICGPNDTSMCPAGTYCHIGENPEMTACCESSGLTDPCLLALNVGQGKALLRRFYYNTFSKRCTEFMYKGTRGNENNFLSQAQCQDTCQKFVNPCRSLITAGQRRLCTVNGSECSSGQFCHIGESAETTVCCPEEVTDPCTQELNEGQGSAEMTRWYMDPDDKSCNKECKKFTYKGLKGNQNNFMTKAACEQKCKKECKNPCGSGTMLLTPTNEPRLCSPTAPCPNTHWCHVGITPDATVCCSAVPNTCDLPMAKGNGNSHLTRWHFDKDLKKCVKFIYSGEGGNQNMFLTKDDCKTVCPVYENPCGTGKPLLIGSEPKICSPSERCPSTHFCHIGTPDAPQYCCPKNGDPCEQKLAIGTGGMALTRYYFDKESKRCREFAYQGRAGNANNFLSLEDCELLCPITPNPCQIGEPLMNSMNEPVICGGEETCIGGYFCHVGGTPETTNCCPGTRRPCDLPLALGDGNFTLDRWFFDGGVQMCRPFVYRGMKGNSNNFLTRQSCRQACKEINPCAFGDPLSDINGDRVQCTGAQNSNSCPHGFFCHVGGSALNTVCCPRKKDTDACDQTVEIGTGGEDLPRWFFDRRQNRCAPFTYGGVGGNENNFISQYTCKAACPEYRNYCPHGIPLIDNGQVSTCGIDRGCPDGFICHMSSEYNVSVCCQDPMDFCLSPRDPGPCTAFEKRYGYNPSSDTCVEYDYGGCEGTLNNFRSLQRCTEICCKEYKRKRL